MSELRIGDRVAVVEVAPLMDWTVKRRLGLIAVIDHRWQPVADAPAPEGMLTAVCERAGQRWYYVATDDDVAVVATEVVSVEPIEVAL